MSYSSWGQKEFDMTEHTRMYICVYVYVYTQTHTQVSSRRVFLNIHYAGRDWGQEEKGTTEDEMAGWHH